MIFRRRGKFLHQKWVFIRPIQRVCSKRVALLACNIKNFFFWQSWKVWSGSPRSARKRDGMWTGYHRIAGPDCVRAGPSETLSADQSFPADILSTVGSEMGVGGVVMRRERSIAEAAPSWLDDENRFGCHCFLRGCGKFQHSLVRSFASATPGWRVETIPRDISIEKMNATDWNRERCRRWSAVGHAVARERAAGRSSPRWHWAGGFSGQCLGCSQCLE